MATQVYPTFVKSAGENGACREYWVKITGLTGLDSNDVAVDVIQNPFQEDMVIWEAFIVVTAASGAVDTALDIGLGESVDASTHGQELAQDLQNEELDTVGVVRELGIVHAIATPPVKPIWKAPLTATTVSSWITTYQDGSVNASTLRYNLLLKVIPYADLV